MYNFFWKILYESSPFGFGKTNENENFVLIFEKVTNVLGETSSYTFLSNISYTTCLKCEKLADVLGETPSYMFLSNIS